MTVVVEYEKEQQPATKLGAEAAARGKKTTMLQTE
jgi:hypothetical protein